MSAFSKSLRRLPGLPAVLGLALLAPANAWQHSGPGTDQPPPATLELPGGRWFDGEGFRSETVYAVRGVLTRLRPPTVDRVLDLDGGWVIPPFAEAHSHNLETPWDADSAIAAYLEAGVFYVKIQADVPELARQVAPRVNRPDSIDVAWAHGCLTGPRGHPIQLYEDVLRSTRYAPLGELPYGWFAGRSYHVVPDERSLELLWPRLLAEAPDFVKVILAYSEEHESASADPSPYRRRGLDPRLLPAVVAGAARAGLRVSAHVETAADFAAAAAAGVAEIAHLPGYYLHTADQAESVRIAAAAAELAARQGTVVVTTTVLSETALRDPGLLPLVQTEQRRNLRLLRAAGVPLAIGSDHSETSVAEALYLRDLGVFEPAELLRVWTGESARAIFPERRIGALRDGYEASFLVLGADPLADFDAVHDIRLAVKQGRPLR